MPLWSFEREGRSSYQCLCDRCEFRGELSETVEGAVQGFHEQASQGEEISYSNGGVSLVRDGVIYLCGVCEGLRAVETLTPEVLTARMIALLRIRSPGLDLQPGSLARAMIDALIYSTSDADFMTVVGDSIMTVVGASFPHLVPPNRANAFRAYSDLEPGHATIDLHAQMPVSALKLNAAKDTKPLIGALLPVWCLEGVLVQRLSDGRVLRVTAVRNYVVQFRDHENKEFNWTRLNPRPSFEDSFAPLSPKTRWDLLDEDDD